MTFGTGIAQRFLKSTTHILCWPIQVAYADELLFKDLTINVDWQVEPILHAEKPEDMSLQFFAQNKDMTVKKPKLKLLRNHTLDLCSESFWLQQRLLLKPAERPFLPEPPPAKVTLMPQSGHSFTLHKPLGYSKCHFFLL